MKIIIKNFFSFRNFVFFICFSFLYLPMLILVIYSFNNSQLITTWKSFSVHWYLVLFHDKVIINAITISLIIAVLTATSSSIIGTIISFIIVRYKYFKSSSIFNIMFTAMLAIPDIVNGLALLLLFVCMNNLFNWPGNHGLIAIWMAHTTFCTAYVTLIISYYLKEKNSFIEEAAINLGASSYKVFFSITLPMLYPAIFAGWLLSFSLSLDDLVIASFVTRPGTTTLPIQVFSMLRRGISPEINALSSIIIIVVSLCSFCAWNIILKNNKIKN